ncbi:MAG: DNA translocase FtsK 4TM domain-containing protein [Proteobacteria bacterium]|nr:DNA translocase FtsK 4TM domain-containing protein [Pseudomonadota bacterium]
MKQTTERSRPGLRQEALAVFGIFISLFLFLCLFSYSFKVKGNWCGEIGMLIAQALFGFTGWGAYLLPSLILLLSLLSFSPGISCNRLPHVVAGLTGAIISFCGLLSSWTIKDPGYFATGGFLGKTVFVLLDSVVGHGGTVLALVLIFLFSLMLSAQFSLYQLIIAMCRLMAKSGALFSRDPDATQEKQQLSENTKGGRRLEKIDKAVFEPLVLQTPTLPTMPELKEPATGLKRSGEDEEFAAKLIARGDWRLPPLTLLSKGSHVENKIDKEAYYKISKQLEQKLKNFGVSGKVVGISPGPVVTTYEYSPAPGVKINKIVGLADDLALGLKAQSVRVVGSVPGKAALGIEIPNEIRQIVYIRELIADEAYRANSHKLSIALGLDVVGNLAMANLAKMPHLLIAGATGAGKSVGINTIIASILYNATPEEVRFLMVDPKRIELSGYEGIPHLLHPVVVDPKLASRALNWAVREMERRYRLLEEARVKSFDSYNETNSDKLPYIVVIVDELADLMMVASKDVEAAIARLAQMARAAGIHLILATQRPSVDVLTGLIKANFPTRISFKVSSKIDSRTILDASGAEHLLGAGDMLLLAPGTAQIKRIHGAFISEKETSDIVEFWKKQGSSAYDDSMIQEIEKDEDQDSAGGGDDFDDRYDEAVALVTQSGQASISMVQRRLRVGYNRAARMIEMMEKEGVIGPADGAKPREVIVRNDYT